MPAIPFTVYNVCLVTYDPRNTDNEPWHETLKQGLYLVPQGCALKLREGKNFKQTKEEAADHLTLTNRPFISYEIILNV